MSGFSRRVRRDAEAKIGRRQRKNRKPGEPRLRLKEAMHAVDQAATLGRSMRKEQAKQPKAEPVIAPPKHDGNPFIAAFVNRILRKRMGRANG